MGLYMNFSQKAWKQSNGLLFGKSENSNHPTTYIELPSGHFPRSCAAIGTTFNSARCGSTDMIRQRLTSFMLRTRVEGPLRPNKSHRSSYEVAHKRRRLSVWKWWVCSSKTFASKSLTHNISTNSYRAKLKVVPMKEQDLGEHALFAACPEALLYYSSTCAHGMKEVNL